MGLEGANKERFSREKSGWGHADRVLHLPHALVLAGVDVREAVLELGEAAGLALGLARRRAARVGERPRFLKTMDSWQMEGSFSAVSKPNFTSKYAFESSRQDLHNALLCTAPKPHFF